MFKFISKSLGKIFGSKYDRDAAEYVPIVDEINTEYERLQSLSHDELRNRTHEFRKRIADHLTGIDEDIRVSKEEASNEPNTLSQLGELDLLVLDAYSSHSSELQHKAQQRKQATRGEIKSRYYQARLPQSATSNDPAKDIMSRRIRGWLEKYVAKQNKTL